MTLKSFVLLIAILSLTACAGVRPLPNGGTAETTGANYPFSEVEAVYDAVLNGMTRKYFSHFPDLDREHTQAMQRYIQDAYPKARFVDEMVRPETRGVLERGAGDVEFRKTKEFQDAFQVLVAVSVPMAKMIIGGQRGVYMAQFVDKDPVRLKLLKIARTEDERQFASWVSGEAQYDDVKKECGAEFAGLPGDEVYMFSSPPETWEDLCGRQGYLVVRGDKIVQTIITILN